LKYRSNELNKQVVLNWDYSSFPTGYSLCSWRCCTTNIYIYI